VEGDSPTLAEYFRRENLGPTPPCDATSARMAVLEGGGESDSGRRLPKGKPRAYATSVSAGRRGGGAVWLGPYLSEGGNPGSTPPAYQLMGVR